MQLYSGRMYFYFFIILFFICSTSVINAQKEGYINSKGVNIFYRSYGEGIPMLVINGGPGMSSDGFVSFAKMLAHNYKVIIYDQRGTGRSLLNKTDSSTINMDLMVQDIENIRTALNINKWIILGHSFGGMLASYYACFHAEHICSLILSSSGGIDLRLLNYVQQSINSKLSKLQRDSVNYWTNKITKGDTSYFARYRRGISLAPAYVFNKKYVTTIASRLTQMNTTVTSLIWSDLQKIHFNCYSKLKKCNIPVLIIQGKQDIIKENTAIRAHDAFKNSEIVLIDHCVHYGWLDQPNKYFKTIKQFIEKNNPS